jgi:CRISPR-associated protein Csb3
MSDGSILVDPRNFGQVAACIGLMEIAEVLHGDAAGCFFGDGAELRFRMEAEGAEDPISEGIEFVRRAEVVALAPRGSALTVTPWQLATAAACGSAFPIALPASAATLPIMLRLDGCELRVDHWGDSSSRDNTKFWAGAGGYPGAAFWRDARDALGKMVVSREDPFAASAPMPSSFRLDFRRDYVPIDAGFSPNAHSNVLMGGYPLVELLAATGLSNARPRRDHKLRYRYGLMSAGPNLLPLVLHRAALGCAALPFAARRFALTLGWPGKVGQARCIIDTIEETQP